MVDADPWEAQAEREADRPVEIIGLCRDMTLVVVEAQYSAVASHQALVVDTVRTYGSHDIKSRSPAIGNSQADLLILRPEEASITTVWIESCHGESACYAKLVQLGDATWDEGDETLPLHKRTSLHEADMAREEEGPQTSHLEHRQRIRGTSQVSKGLGMPDVTNLAQ